MADYAQPAIRTNPDHIVIHVGTNDLSSEEEPPEIPSAIVETEISFPALKLKSDTCQVSVSNLTTRNDQYRKKALEVNQHLKVLCHKENINIDHGNTITVRHLNGPKLLLNLIGNKVLTEKFTDTVSNVLHWQFLLHSLRKANDGSYSFHNCGKCKATSERYLMNIKSLKDIRQKKLGKIVIGHLKY